MGFSVWLSPYIRATCSTWSSRELCPRLCRARRVFPDYLHKDLEELMTELAAGSQTVGCAHSSQLCCLVEVAQLSSSRLLLWLSALWTLQQWSGYG